MRNPSQIFIFLFLFILSLSSKVYAQVFPVQVTTLVRPPYSLNLSDYASPSYDRVQANLYMADLTKVNYPVKVRLTIRGAGGINLTTIPGQEIGPIFLNGGQMTMLTGADLHTLFSADKLNFSGFSLQQYKQNSALPEGIYQIHFEILDYNFGLPISNANSGFATAWLVLNDPPIINKPENNITVVPSNPQNILFQWTPRHTGSPNSALNTVYDMQIVEIYPVDRNPNDAILTSPSIFEKTINIPTYNYTTMDPTLVSGKWYAFRIRARDVNGMDLFKNQGYSEVYKFYYGETCPIPQDIQIEQTDERSVLLHWINNDQYLSSDIQYKGASVKNWSTVNSTKNSAMITGLTPGEVYEFRLAGKCKNNVSELSEGIKYKNGGGVVNTSCAPPESYKAEKISSTAKDMTVRITWQPVANVKRYNLYVETASDKDKYSVKSSEVKGTSTDPLFIQEFDVPVGTFKLTFETECTDGSVTKGKTDVIDLGQGNLVSGNCVLPDEKEVNVKVDLLSANITWASQIWFDQYTFRYRELNNNLFTEVKTNKPSVIIDNLVDGKIYEYQILYHCQSGTWLNGEFNVFKVVLPAAKRAVPSTGNCFPPSDIKDQVNADMSATISWPKDKDVDSYKIYYGEKGTPQTTWTSIDVKGNEGQIKNLKANTEYEYAVASVCKDGSTSIPSLKQSFNTANIFSYNGPCEAPILRKPTVNSNVEATVEWEPKTYYTGYLLQYRDKGNATWMDIKLNLPTRLIENLTASTTYEYHVSAFCGVNQSDYTVTDTFRTNAIPPAEFACGQDKMIKIKSTNPIPSLKKGDKFTAADFELTITKLETERPYKGEATAPIPYLKNSTFMFGFEKVMVNEYGQMYEGKAYLKGANISAIDPKLAGKINDFVDKLDAGLEKASTYLTMADSIQDALNDIVQTANEPIDWKKYEGWTAQQLLDEGKRLVKEGQKLLAAGTPQSIAQAKKMMMEGIQLVKSAAAFGKQVATVVSAEIKAIFKRVFTAKNDSLKAEREKLKKESQLLKEIDKYNGFTVADTQEDKEDNNSNEQDTLNIPDSEWTEIPFDDLKNDASMATVMNTYEKEKDKLVSFVVVEKAIIYIADKLNNPDSLDEFITAVTDAYKELDLTKITSQSLIDDLEKKIKNVMSAKLKDL